MEVIYRPLLPATQYCPCNWQSSFTSLDSLPQSKHASPFLRVLLAPYVPLWVNPTPATTDNSSDDSEFLQQAGINYRSAFEQQKREAAKKMDATTLMMSLYVPKGRWQWTYQVPFENRPEEDPVTSNRVWSLSVRTARIYNESITYICKLYPREIQWEGFFSEVKLHKTQLRPLHGASTPALIGIQSNITGIQLAYDIPHHSFWIQASPDIPDVLKRRCLDAYHQLHAQGVLHGNVDLANILIGGDGRVQIINFHKSRSTKHDPKVHLGLATPQDFNMEMREVHYKLDYLGAREKERAVWENRRNSRQNPSRRTTRRRDKDPYAIPLEPPIDPVRWLIPNNWKPKRFVVPGQSREQFEHHLRQFLLDLEKSQTHNKGDRSQEPNRCPPGDRSPPPARFDLGKRKRGEVDSDSDSEGDGNSSSKRVRFLAQTNHDDGSKGKVRSPPPPGVKRQVPRISREYQGTGGGAFFLGEDVPGAYNRPPPLQGLCPEITPQIDYNELFAAWKSVCSRRSNDGKHAKDQDDNSKNDGRSEQALGKRRQIDDNDSSRLDDGFRPKRLRRSETTVWESDNSTHSSDKVCRVTPKRYATRSSTRQSSAQPVAGSPEISGSSSLVVTRRSRGSLNSSSSGRARSLQANVGPLTIGPPCLSSKISGSQVNPPQQTDVHTSSTRHPSGEQSSLQLSVSTTSQSLGRSGSHQPTPSSGTPVIPQTDAGSSVTSSWKHPQSQLQGNKMPSTATPIPISPLLIPIRYIKTQGHSNGSRSRAGGGVSDRRVSSLMDSLEPIALVDEESAPAAQPPGASPPIVVFPKYSAPVTEHTEDLQEPASMETLRLQLPGPVRTFANRIGCIFGFW